MNLLSLKRVKTFSHPKPYQDIKRLLINQMANVR